MHRDLCPCRSGAACHWQIAASVSLLRLLASMLAPANRIRHAYTRVLTTSSGYLCTCQQPASISLSLSSLEIHHTSPESVIEVSDAYSDRLDSPMPDSPQKHRQRRLVRACHGQQNTPTRTVLAEPTSGKLVNKRKRLLLRHDGRWRAPPARRSYGLCNDCRRPN